MTSEREPETMAISQFESPLRVAIYVRQSVKEDQGIEQQIAACEARVSAEGWESVGIYNDNRQSATKERGADTNWARMLQDIDAGRIDVVVSVTVARLIRRISDVLKLTERGIRVVTCRDGIDTSSGLGKAVLTILVALAEAEIEEKEARARPYRVSRRAKGHPTPGMTPYGYRWVPKARRDENETRFEIVTNEADALRFMFAEALAVSSVSRTSLAAICRALNDGTATLDGKHLDEMTRTTRQGKPWGTSTVRRLLVSPYSAALLPPVSPLQYDTKGKRIAYRAEDYELANCSPGAWQPIVSADQVAAVRHLLSNPQRRNHDGNVSRKWMLTGIATCACGEGIRSGTTKERYRSYRGQCGHFQRRAEVIDAFVARNVIEALGAPGRLERTDESGTDLAELRARRIALQGQRIQLLSLIQPNGYTADEVMSRTPPIDAEIASIDTRLAEALKADPLGPFVTVDDVEAVWDGLTLARRQVVVRALFDAVVIHPVGKGVRATMDAPAVRLEWSGEARRRMSMTTGQPYTVPMLSAMQRETIGAVLTA